MIPDVMEIAILEMCRVRGNSSFCPSEIARWLYPEDWRDFMPEVRESMMNLYRDNRISVTQKGVEVDKNFLPKGPVRIQPITKKR
ncbi:hypothetical protein ADIS_1407 [Lunatimonas lonarensis]|uniref:DUF3253 domain-containing protein n=1 Tax=Lunatimonas lonarensis TaxID=1232681 RepID=R7ZVP0_9BACT|nr:DUF3253 domain-containing protein [Lunatimonas lonarensis]EON78210.1 hypothetical protein ADIS_1407 [Lunatimonas lonarensis]